MGRPPRCDLERGAGQRQAHRLGDHRVRVGVDLADSVRAPAPDGPVPEERAGVKLRRNDVHGVVAAPLHAVGRAGHPAAAAVLRVRGGARLAPQLAVAVGEAGVALEAAGALVAGRGAVGARAGAVRRGRARRRAAVSAAPAGVRRRIGELVEPDDPAAARRDRKGGEDRRGGEKSRSSGHGRRLPWDPGHEGSVGDARTCPELNPLCSSARFLLRGPPPQTAMGRIAVGQSTRSAQSPRC